MRAGKRARPVKLALSGSMSVGEALQAARRARAQEVVVLSGRCAQGWLRRSELAAAAAHGLAHLSCVEILAEATARVAPDDGDARVRRVLESRTPPRLLVGASETSLTGILGPEDVPRGSRRPVERMLRADLNRALPSAAVRVLREIGRRAGECGGAAYLVGGAVRDLLLGRALSDLDVTLEVAPSRVASRLQGAWTAHPAFQTGTLVLRGGTRLDLARCRAERYDRPAALPRVRAADLAADLRRRDFTVNTLAIRLEPGRFGRLLDNPAAQEDLRATRIRVLHGLSFVDDPTRVLRGIELAARLRFSFSRGTRRLIEVTRREELLERLSPARLRRETRRLLGGAHVARSVDLLHRLGLAGLFLPAREPLANETRARLRRVAAVVGRYGERAGLRPTDRWLVPLGLLCRDAPQAEVDRCAKRVQATRSERRILEGASDALRKLEQRLRRTRKASSIHRACRSLDGAILLMALTAPGRGPVHRGVARYLETLREVRLEISGRDLIDAGFPAGPAIARALDAALEARLDGKAPDRSEQLRRACLTASTHLDYA